MQTLPPEIAASSPDVREHYRSMIAGGATERWALMCALQQPPGTKGTDRAFMQGRYAGEWLNQMNTQCASRITSEARKAGISVAGKFYMGGLADSRGHLDPKAWIDSVADIKKVAQERNLHVQGIVDYTPPERAPQKSVDIAPDILREQVIKELKADPKLKRGEAVEKAKERIVPHWKKKGK